MARLTDRAQNDLKCVEGPLNRYQTKIMDQCDTKIDHIKYII